MPEFSNNWFRERTVPIWDKYVKGMEIKSYLEVGVCEGQSMRWILENLQPEVAVGVDWWQDLRDKKHEVFRQYKETCFENLHEFIVSGQLTLIESTSQDFFADHKRRYHEAFDLIYIDADHSAYACMADMMMAYDMLKKNTHVMNISSVDRHGRHNRNTKVGGTMLVDDCHRFYNQGSPLVKIAVHAFELVMHGRMHKVWSDGRQMAFIRTA